MTSKSSIYNFTKSKDKNMKFIEIIQESLYDLSFIKSMNKYIIQNLDTAPKKRNGYRVLDISEFIPKEYNKKNLKVYVSFKKVGKTHPDSGASWANYNPKTKTVFFQIHRNVSYSKAREEDENYEYDVSRHETIHMLDFLRDKTQRGDKDIKDLAPDAPDTSESSDDKGLLHYVKDAGEFNVAINVLNRIKRNDPKTWNSIANYDQLLELMILKAPLSFEGAGKHVLKDNDLRKTIFRRLYREKLLPPNLKIS
jgi:hypothetical protein